MAGSINDDNLGWYFLKAVVSMTTPCLISMWQELWQYRQAAAVLSCAWHKGILHCSCLTIYIQLICRIYCQTIVGLCTGQCKQNSTTNNWTLCCYLLWRWANFRATSCGCFWGDIYCLLIIIPTVKQLIIPQMQEPVAHRMLATAQLHHLVPQ